MVDSDCTNIWLSGGDWTGFREFLRECKTSQILHIPLALDPQGERFATCEVWMAERIAQADPLNQYHLQCLKDPNTPLLPFSGIVMSGGNTYRLRHVLRASGLDGVLAQAIRSGIPVYGISAGATVLGADIDISVDKHPEYTACDGLVLVQGLTIRRSCLRCRQSRAP